MKPEQADTSDTPETQDRSADVPILMVSLRQPHERIVNQWYRDIMERLTNVPPPSSGKVGAE